MQRADSLEKTLVLGKIEGRRRRGWQRMKWLNGITDSVDMNLSKLQEMVEDRRAWRAAVHGVSKSRTWLSNWRTTEYLVKRYKVYCICLLTISLWINLLGFFSIGKSHGLRSLVGCSPWGHTELDTTERLHFHALEKEMATHSSVLAWRIPGTGGPSGLPSMASHRVGHDWSDLAAAAFENLQTPYWAAAPSVFLCGLSRRQRLIWTSQATLTGVLCPNEENLTSDPWPLDLYLHAILLLDLKTKDIIKLAHVFDGKG